MNKGYKTNPGIKVLSDKYWKAKILIESAVNGDYKDKEFVRSLSVEDLENLHTFITECENVGVQYVGRIKN